MAPHRHGDDHDPHAARRPPRAWTSRSTSTARVEAKGDSPNGPLRFTSELVEGSTTNHDGATTARKIWAGLVRNRAYGRGIGDWRELTWTLPAGMTQAEADALDDTGYFPLEVLLPNRHVGVGATWTGSGPAVTTDLRRESIADTTYSVRAIDAAGAEILKVVQVAVPDVTRTGGPFTYEQTNGRSTVNQIAWVHDGQLPYRLEAVEIVLFDVVEVNKNGERARPAKLKMETKTVQKNIPHK